MKTLVFDTETTALIGNSLQPLGKQPKLIEFFSLLLDESYAEISVINQLINPAVPLPAKSEEITSITEAMLKNAPTFDLVAEKLLAEIEKADCVVAHNLKYDMQVMDFSFQRLERKVRWPARRVCTVEATESMKGFRLSLSALHQELFGEAFTGAHRAEHDVRALARCYIELVNRGEI